MLCAQSLEIIQPKVRMFPIYRIFSGFVHALLEKKFAEIFP